VRGGWQRTPMRVNDSIVSHQKDINQGVTNSLFLALHSLRDNHYERLMPQEEAQAIVDKMITTSEQEPTAAATRSFKNVVFFLLESWSTRFLDDPAYADVTPFFQSLRQRGHWFPHFYANGFRSSTGIFSSLTCRPDLMGVPMIRRSDMATGTSSLSQQLRQKGYQNLFFHGGELDFDNMNNFLTGEGFHSLQGKEFFENLYPDMEKGAWGVDDHTVMQQMAQELEAINDPYFALTFTTTTHTPYYIPTQYKDYIPLASHLDDPEYNYLNALHFTDFALEKFFIRFQKAPAYAHTLFAFTGDHTHHRGLKRHDDIHIPFLLFADSFSPQTVTATGQQTDIVPTLSQHLDLHSKDCMGKNLYRVPSDKGFAFSIRENSFVWIEPQKAFVIQPPQNLIEIFSLETGDEVDASSEEKNQALIKAQAWFQRSLDILKSPQSLTP
jgi:phosphoglycerol transferase MdoB-like AlkP superfamily enzyme